VHLGTNVANLLSWLGLAKQRRLESCCMTLSQPLIVHQRRSSAKIRSPLQLELSFQRLANNFECLLKLTSFLRKLGQR